jgi:hypothetical protein
VINFFRKDQLTRRKVIDQSKHSEVSEEQAISRLEEVQAQSKEVDIILFLK